MAQSSKPASPPHQEDDITLQEFPASALSQPIAEPDVCVVDLVRPTDASDTSNTTLPPSLSVIEEASVDIKLSINQELAQDVNLSFTHSSNSSIAEIIDMTFDDHDQDHSMGLNPPEDQQPQADEPLDENQNILDDPTHEMAVEDPPKSMTEISTIPQDHDLTQLQEELPNDFYSTEPSHTLEASAEPTLILVDSNSMGTIPDLQPLSLDLELVVPGDKPTFSNGTQFILNHDLMSFLIVRLTLRCLLD